MAAQITPNTDMTFVVATMPTRSAPVKTIERLMGMHTDAQRARQKVARQRALKDNVKYIRAGRPWVNRARATKVVRCVPGAEFSIRVTPQIMGDLKSVERYLEAR
ncbi:MAG: hypothetical protein MK101_08765 [Phycisphaerales bacterium]|nr:hypothetical protein [Phycisphaerales bacterium]